MLTKLSQQNPKYFCEYCNIKTNNKKDYEKHLMTSKHSKLTNVNKMLTESPQKAIICDFICQNCNKEYKSRVGLWKHRKICNINIITDIDNKDETVDKDQLILMLIKQNSELIKETSGFKNMMMEQQNIMLEVIKNGTHNNSNNITNNNSNNKTFNLQFFLNETCKDAMNIMDFVDSIKLQLSDLENVGKNGYVEGISSIIVKNLNSLDENKQKITKAIKYITHKNSKLLNDFRYKHPDCIKSNSKFSDQYNKLVIEALGGKGDNELEKEDKIIRNIAKQVTIDSKA